MKDMFTVYHDQQAVGSMHVEKCGLYYQFCCRCNLRSGSVFTVEACCGDNKVNLGICVPCGDGFGLKTRIPVKRFGAGQWRFSVKPKHAESEEHFFPVRADEPFAYLHRLQSARLAYRDGQQGIIFSD